MRIKIGLLEAPFIKLGNMSINPDFPHIESHLPEMMSFAVSLAQAFEAGEIDTWQAMANRVHTFFTPDMLDKVNAVVPGWREMVSYAEGVTLVHVMCVFTALLLCPEYQSATTEQQALMKWVVLFHDIAKQVQRGKRDHIHGFRSAVITAEVLPRLGFSTANEYRLFIKEWMALTYTAITRQDETGDYVQDNQQLPEIIDGIEKMFGRSSTCTLIAKTVLLHVSINVLSEWPQAAPLTKTQAKQYIDAQLFPILKTMMLADNDGWELFDPHTKVRHRREILAALEEFNSEISK